MKQTLFEELIGAALRIDDLKKDHVVLKGIEQEAKQFIHAQEVQFFFYNQDKKSLYRPYNSSSPRHYELFQNEIGLLSEIAFSSSGRGGMIKGSRLQALEQCQAKKKEVIKNLYISPVRDSSRTYGLLVAFNLQKVKDESEKTLEMFASIIAIFLRHYKLTNRKVQQLKENKSITELNQYLFRTKNMSGFYEKVIDLLHQHLKTERISIILKHQEDTNTFYFASGRSIEPEVLLEGVVTLKENVLSWVMKHKKGIWCNNIDQEDRFGNNKKLRYTKKSFMVLPIFEGSQVIGFLNSAERFDKKNFDAKDYSYATSIAESLGQGIAFLKSHGLYHDPRSFSGQIAEEMTETSAQKQHLQEMPPDGADATKEPYKLFINQYQEWLDMHQREFDFAEKTAFIPQKKLPLASCGTSSSSLSLLSVMHLIAAENDKNIHALKKVQETVKTLLNYVIKKNVRAKDAYKHFRKEYCHLMKKQNRKTKKTPEINLSPPSLSMWVISKEKKTHSFLHRYKRLHLLLLQRSLKRSARSDPRKRNQRRLPR